MNKLFHIVSFCFLMTSVSGFCQQKPKDILVAIDTVEVKINPLAPAKAAFYSALLPGLGQAYNKKYWKIPLVFGAIGAGVYSYSWNKNKYNEYRDAYKQRLLFGVKSPDRFNNIGNGVFLSPEKLIAAQKQFQKQRDLSLLVTSLLYVLNIIDANVDGHLKQFNVNEKLTVKPEVYQNNLDYNRNFALTLNYRF